VPDNAHPRHGAQGYARGGPLAGPDPVPSSAPKQMTSRPARASVRS
jgi:hypothetical protein